ncbi:ABC transporter ATP-binding protein [uncultured Clostridium sp.]|uniref:ABC transporter ATP-binding protein n=1 Tax=uncultured Clostridium sp. TaxID=59620 RepID=UPI0028E64713|nr:ABC transporter ATP-binding protein [uncultured Clostridium sp.]
MKGIVVENLTKTYDGIYKAIENISFSIEQGSIVGFLGPNGSGKTTTIRILNGILEPTTGGARILGKDIVKEAHEIRKICGVMTETAACYENLSGKENLMFFGKLHDLPHLVLKTRVEDILKKLGLYEHKDKKVKEYSTGMKKRISLAIALINNPKIVFLDEPTSGLDPETAQNVTELIKNMVYESGTTVFMCTHQLRYAEDICDTYGFINKGKILGFGKFKELGKEKGIKDNLIIRGYDIPNNLGFLEKSSGIYKKEISSEEEIPQILTNVINKGGKIYEVKNSICSLEELYFAYTRGDKIE